MQNVARLAEMNIRETSPQPEEEHIPQVDTWPEPLAKEALHGLAGDIVRTIDPHTEADPAALLFSFFVTFGNVIGRTAHFVAEADRHFLNLFSCMTGTTAKGRKGTSYGQIKRIIECVDEVWAKERITQGMSSGEGLIWAVRDELQQKNKKGIMEVLVDGVDDKRLLVVESEFASVIRVFNREGNRLSPVIRQAWDTGNLNTLTKNNPAKATDAHISILAHITKDELLRYLESTEAGNGFGNRYLWVCVRRSKCLPDGGQLDGEVLAPLIERVQRAVTFGRKTGELIRNDEARQLWHTVYPELSEGKPGLLGAMIARSEAQVMRLAGIYAVLDTSSVIRLEHLKAALSCWDYCEQSARYIFGDALGDPVADEILKALKMAPSGLTRTDISKHFGRNKGASEIGRALKMLSERGLASPTKEPSPEGRPVERWLLTLTK